MNALRIIRTGFTCMLLVVLAQAGQAQSTNAARSIDELRAQITAHVTAPRFNQAHWSIQIASLDTGQTIFEHHPDRLMSPASNCKLYAGALALDHFGSDYRITTSVYATAEPGRSGRLKGDLIVVGRGDPSWRLDSGATDFQVLFDPFVTVLTNAGIRRVTGDLIADATFIQGPPSGASWTVDDMEDYYGAEISAITLSDNYAQLRVTPGKEPGQPCGLKLVQPHTGLILHNQTTTLTNGAGNHIRARRIVGETGLYVFGGVGLDVSNVVEDVTVPRPANWFAAGLKDALERRGIRVLGDARSVRWPEPSPLPSDAVLLGEISSPPMRDLVHDFMKPSQNLETDLVFDHLGETTRSAATPPLRTSEQLAVDALEVFLKTNGLPANDLHFDEGSGLSRNNLTSARLTLELLKFMTTHPASNEFMNALPVAGVDGTLRRRMKGTPAEGNVRAKTGTLRWVNALSGYVTSEAGERFVFSLMLNRNVAQPGRSGRQELEAIALMLARFASRSDITLESVYTPQGRLFLVPMANAPFPHPARAEGHVYKGQWYTADHYQDNTVALFVPAGFRETEAVDFVVFFHGWGNSAVKSLASAKLIEQFAGSGRNAILAVPTGPLNASDSFGGKLEEPGGFTRFMTEVIETLHRRGVLTEPESAVGGIALAGHSGGYRVIASILHEDPLATHVREVWLFDALYGRTADFLQWQADQNGRLLVIYTDEGGTLNETQHAMELCGERGVDCLNCQEEELTRADLENRRVAFIRTALPHGAVVAQGGHFQAFLETSGLGQQ